MESLEKIDDYLSGKLSEIEKSLFEIEIKNNQILETELSKQFLAQEAIKQLNIRKLVKETQQNYLTENNTELIPLPIIKKSWGFYLSRIAASLAIFSIGLGLSQFANLSAENLLADNNIQYKNPIMRGEKNNTNEIENKYKIADYKAVINIFEKNKSNIRKDEFLVAMAYHNLHIYDKSSEIVERLLINYGKNSPYYNELNYYKGLNLIGMNKYDEAIAYFEKLRNDIENPYSKNITTTFMLKIKALNFKKKVIAKLEI